MNKSFSYSRIRITLIAQLLWLWILSRVNAQESKFADPINEFWAAKVSEIPIRSLLSAHP